jgi:hypothetical protein
MEKQSTRSYQLFYTQIWKKSALANNANVSAGNDVDTIKSRMQN